MATRILYPAHTRGQALNIDFHNHFYPKGYMDELSREEGYARVERDDQGRLLVHYEGDYIGQVCIWAYGKSNGL